MPREIHYRGRKIQVARDTDTGPNGEEVHRDVVLHPGAVAILPLVDADHICLLRNTRPAVGETLWEIPAGTLEPGEAPDLAAARELAEETGYHAAHWRKLLVGYPSPGVLSEKMHLYLASDLTPGQARPELDEQLEAHVVKWSDALTWVMEGKVHDMKTIVAVLFWARMS
jgi:ADP-ribose pyrophosphatase